MYPLIYFNFVEEINKKKGKKYGLVIL